jgi:hypothetical protein
VRQAQARQYFSCRLHHASLCISASTCHKCKKSIYASEGTFASTALFLQDTDAVFVYVCRKRGR